MKKIFLLAAAVIAFAACSNIDVVENPASSPIDFNPNALLTKTLILPGSSMPDSLAFPTSESFSVFAFANITGVTNYATPLMDNVEISYHATATGGDWKATTGTYLWPATGTVDFYAYHPASLNAKFDTLATPKAIEIKGVSLGTVVGDQIDPLVAATLSQLAASKPKVGLVFKHITSQIAVAAYDATSTASLQGKISIEKVVFTNMKTSGDYAEGTTIGKGNWTNVNTTNNFTSFSGSEVLATTESYLSAGSFAAAIDNSAAFVVIPENIINDNVNGQAIEVTYSIAAYTINGFDYPATPSQTVTIPVYGRVANDRFECGKRYVFHLGISLDGANNEIMFSPVVEGWNTVDVNGIVVDAVNATLL